MMHFPTQPAAAGAEDFVKWLGGYLDGLRVCADLGARPPAHLDQIYAKLAELREQQKPKTASISIHRNDALPPGAMYMSGGVIARTLELRPAEMALQGFARGAIVNAVAHAAASTATFGEQTRAGIHGGSRP